MFRRSSLLAAVMLVVTGSALYGQSALGPAEAAQDLARGGGQPAAAQPATVCGTQVQPPTNLPPAGSGPVVWLMAPCFEKQGNVSLIDTQTYLYYIQLKDKLSSPL